MRSNAMAVLLGATLALAACKEYGPPKSGAGKPSRAEAEPQGPGVPTAGDAKLAGRVRMGNKQWPVRTFIGHDAKMDLRIHCLTARDAAQKSAEGDANAPKPELCFDPKMVAKISRVRVETAKGATGGQLIRTLRSRNEAAHFMVERSGSLYQLLDMGLSPRRAGKIQRGEVRIVSANTSGQARLVASLVELLGKVPVVETKLAVMKAPQPPKPRSPNPGHDQHKPKQATP